MVVEDDRRDRYRKTFTRLDPKRRVHGANFRDAGYTACRVGGWAMRDWAAMQQWCHDSFGDRYVWVGDTFWFVSDDDAFLFRMTWSLGND